MANELLSKDRPRFENGDSPIRVVDLFSGCGGLTLGVAQAAAAHRHSLDVRLAVDFELDPLRVFARNFSNSNLYCGPVESLFDGSLGDAQLTKIETRVASAVGVVDVLLAGPPCQGNSNLNNSTRRTDPRNKLYLRAVRAVEVLRPSLVIIENVPAVVHSRPDVLRRATDCLRELGYQVESAVIDVSRLGIAQRRKRHVLVATCLDTSILASLGKNDAGEPVPQLRDAIGDLVDLEDCSGIDAWPRASKTNLARMHWLLRNEKWELPNRLRPKCHQNDSHSYRSVYGRLRWDRPAQTITSGFSSIGQGRYMHPELARALTIHEAARIQGFPDYFTFGAVDKRTALAKMIGNAVPPALSRSVAESFLQRRASQQDGWVRHQDKF